MSDLPEEGHSEHSPTSESLGLTLPGLTFRAQLRRRVLLGVDPFLGLVSDSWVALFRLRKRDLKSRIDPQSGRLTAAAVREIDLDPSIEPLVIQAQSVGVDPGLLDDAMKRAQLKSANLIAKTCVDTTPGMLREHRSRASRISRRMRAVWGEAFDSFFAVYVALEEYGSNLQILYGDSDDRLNQALLAVNARTCLILAEVHALMSAGFPHGAHARARTLYENSVIADVLCKHGRTPGAVDLAERFLAHPVADHKRDLDRLRESGFSLDAAQAASVEARLAELTTRYGKIFAKDYGWALPLFPKLDPDRSNIGFDRLDGLANDRILDRSDYRQAGHHVHASAWSIVLTEYERNGSPVRLTGSTNVGFGEPGRIALAAGLDSAKALLSGLHPTPDLVHTISMLALEQLMERTVALFEEAEQYIWSREDRARSGSD